MTNRLHVDIETYSEAELKSGGVYKYAEHPSTEVLCIVLALNDEMPTLWIPTTALGLPPIPLMNELTARCRQRYVVTGVGGDPLKGRQPLKFDTLPIIHIGDMPEWARKYVADPRGGLLAAHNAQFERTILNGLPGQRIGWPRTDIERWICTAAKARAAGLPGSLGDGSAALGTFPKDESGRGVMLQLCRPRTGENKRWSYHEVVDKYCQLWTYCIEDVLAERALDAACPDLTPPELEIWQLDQLINDRGVGVDLVAIDQIQKLIDQYKEELEKDCAELTGFKPTQRAKVVEWVRANGYPQIPDMTADTVRLAMKDEKCPKDVRTVLSIYSTYGMKAVSKYEAMKEAACRDSRIHGMFLYYGAGTGRWSSLIVQLQNIARGFIKDPDTAIAAATHGMEAVRFLYEDTDPMKVFASCVRGMLIPQVGKILQAIDFSGIESRVTAWLFGEEWKLAAFRAQDRDPKQPDNYEMAYATGFGISPALVTEYMRQIGKVMELSLGYEGGVSAFVTMAPNYKVDLVELARAARPALPEWALNSAEWMWANHECKKGNPTGLAHDVYTTIDAIKQVWRSAHPKIKQGWKDLNEAAIETLKTGRPYAIPNKKVIFGVKDRWLCMKLPSGRMLRYFEPELHTRKTKKTVTGPNGEQYEEVRVSEYVTYMGINTETRQWGRTGTYGGKLTENAVQAIAGDLLRGAMLRLERAGFPIVMTVHDEVVSEIDPDFSSLKTAEKIMCVAEKWALDLPINAEGFRAKRFKK